MDCEHYAVLIGVNTYPREPLQGCVRDIRNMKKYLEGLLNPVRLRTFVTSEIADSKSNGLAEDPLDWPTYHHVTTALKETTALAKPGSFVYIHYSGHGTRIDASSGASNKLAGDLALVLLQGGEERYLRGLELVDLLKPMVDKGLIVTLVLDCCCAGSVLRNDASVRYLSYDPKVDAKFPPVLGRSMISHEETQGSTCRDVSMLPNWILKSSGYAILAACGEHETAREGELEGEIHGVLSYFLLRTLTRRGGLGKRQEDIYHHLRANFKSHSSKGPEQNPALYGDRKQWFFGHVSSEIHQVSIQAFRGNPSSHSLQLQVGQAHGVHRGDHFTVYPLSSGGHHSTARESAVNAKVVYARAFDSDLEPANNTSFSRDSWWRVTPRLCFALQRFPIPFEPRLPNLDEWLGALDKRSLHAKIEEEAPFAFYVLLNSNKEYEIKDWSRQKIVDLPTLPYDQMDTSEVCNVLEHLCRFQWVTELGNNAPTDSFQESFDVQVINRTNIYHAGHLVEVEQDNVVGFTCEIVVKNKGDKELYYYIYNMGPLWQIENIFGGNHKTLLPGAKKTWKLTTKVPTEMREQGYHYCDDVVKVFLTSQLTSFDALELPILGGSMQRTIVRRTGRVEASHQLEEWATLNFPIRTHKPR